MSNEPNAKSDSDPKAHDVSVVAVVGTRATGHVVILEVDERFYFTDDYSGSGLTPIYIRDWMSSLDLLARNRITLVSRLRQSRKARQFRQFWRGVYEAKSLEFLLWDELNYVIQKLYEALDDELKKVRESYKAEEEKETY